MSSSRKTLLLLTLCLGLDACEQTAEPTATSQVVLTTEQQAALTQQLQQALALQELQLQQQVYRQTFNSVQAHQQQLDQQLKTFSATQACALAGNCRVETSIVPVQ